MSQRAIPRFELEPLSRLKESKVEPKACPKWQKYQQSGRTNGLDRLLVQDFHFIVERKDVIRDANIPPTFLAVDCHDDFAATCRNLDAINGDKMIGSKLGNRPHFAIRFQPHTHNG